MQQQQQQYQLQKQAVAAAAAQVAAKSTIATPPRATPVEVPHPGKEARAPPMVALVGRPNVGKSALFNRLVGADAAIVHGRPGVTRDQMARKAEWCGRTYTLVDCGGLSDDADGGRAAFEAERSPKRRERDIAATQLPRVIRDHAQRAVASADVLLFVVDGQAGPTAADADGARAPAWKRGR